ncbi:MAG TPA: DUF3316 domain-containing protein [Paludibacter sp.]|nr:DUF3316 domain-containing protein [Paludibacter sp.]
MKKIVVPVLVFFHALCLSAQNDEGGKSLLTNHARSTRLSVLNLVDPYLSPLPYSGIGVGYEAVRGRFLGTENLKYSLHDKLDLSVGMLVNPAVTNSMAYFGVDYGAGVQYHYRVRKNILVLGGMMWDALFGMKMVDRNINNPYNFDLATNLNLAGTLVYDYPLRRRTLRFALRLQTPLVGCMFVPEGGASYYEMFELGNLANAFHFSSLHNKRGLNRMLSVDVPFNRSVWRFGFGYNDLKFSANNLVFKEEELGVSIGVTFDVARFAGRRNPAPHNFIGIYE